MIKKLWHWYTQAIGILAIAAGISTVVMMAGSRAGPVIEVTTEARPLSTMVPYLGTLAYRVSTKRNESCPGTVIYTFVRDVPSFSVVLSQPVPTVEIRPTTNRVVRIELPDSVYPGKWTFQTTVHSQCPTYMQTDLIAEFPIEVISSEPE